MKVLFIASEAVPFIKTGGLADVIGTLPLELRKLGIDARLVLPKYGDIDTTFQDKMVLKNTLSIKLGGKYHQGALLKMECDGVPCYFIEHDYFFNRKGIYGFEDDAARFAFFSSFVLEILPRLDFRPQILHCHDWHTGMVSFLLKTRYSERMYYKRIRTLFTIHNLGYKGLFPRKTIEDLFEIEPQQYFTINSIEFFGQGSYLKGGLVFSDYITTVSKTYAREIQTPFYGEGLDDILRKRSNHLQGILNGLDYQHYNPLSDPSIFVPFRYSFEKKLENKLKLQEILRLPQDREIPLIAFINRLVKQKGLDLINQARDELLGMNTQLIFLGKGEEKYEVFLQQLADSYPDRVSANIIFDDTLARKIYAASDMFLMPSLYEPCGISQLIAMSYGSAPIVRETGGLKDTVKEFNKFSKEGNGFSFKNYDAFEMLSTIKRAVKLYRDKHIWSKLMKNAVETDYSWKKPAKDYLELYRRMLNATC
ncbi:MAG TPA: glycogen synthase GlgA [Firmicutes bacterium]|jgi:starch synthase|nr:glycogen synthase GlgA [Bacillota bacterium]